MKPRTSHWGVAVVWVMTASQGAVLSAASDLRLVEAVQKQDTSAVRGLLRQVDVNVRQPDGTSALAWAAHWNDLATADLLIRAGADVNASNDYGVTPLILACTNRSAEMAGRLLKAGADPNAATITGVTPIMEAARTGALAVVNGLVAQGANVNGVERWRGQTALMWAASERHPDVVRALAEAGADVHVRSALRNKGSVKTLTGERIKAVVQEGGFTALLFAAREGDLETVRALIAAGANVHDTTDDGDTTVMVAASMGHEALAIFLLEQGVDPNASGPGYTTLHIAIPFSQVDLVKALLARGADPNAPLVNPQLYTPKFGHAYGGSVVAYALEGATPFFLATRFLNVPLMRTLVANGAAPLLPTKDGTTPIIMAAGIGQPRGLQIGPANPRVQFRAGNRAAWWSERAAVQAIDFLLTQGADINGANDAGETPLHGAAYHGANEIVQFLVDKGARLDALNKENQTPLLIADGHSQEGASFFTFPETAALLGKLGADPTLGTRRVKGVAGVDQEAIAGGKKK